MPIKVLTTVLGKLLRIRQVTIMGHTNPMGIIRVERLRLRAGAGASGGIADMAQTEVALQVDHVMGLEDVLDEAIVFSEVESAAFGGDDSSGVLTAMLEDR
mmetsp:Transcript_32635/g.68620  ORF Transcript_32635/g.68620 Transcript_32635/m.68620 type:complete len:101 (+) Transcript_32635:1315-1617(+)